MPKLFDPLMDGRKNTVEASKWTRPRGEETGYVDALIAAEDGRMIPVKVNDKERLVFPIPIKE